MALKTHFSSGACRSAVWLGSVGGGSGLGQAQLIWAELVHVSVVTGGSRGAGWFMMALTGTAGGPGDSFITYQPGPA